jgi:hypothetical protein
MSRPSPLQTTRSPHWLVPALLLAWWLSPPLALAALAARMAAPDPPAAVAAQSPPASATTAPAATPASPEDPRGYAEREARAQLEAWTGGDGVYISGGVLLIALIVALFLLILR